VRVEIRVTIVRATLAVFSLLTFASLPRPTTAQEPAAGHRTVEHRVPLISRDGAVYVRARVNGNSAILLIDTGAVLTTFNFKLVPTQETGSRITINMAKGSVLAFRQSVGFTLGESNVREEHCSFHQNAIVGDFKFGAADGVIGLDVLGSFKSVTFDFKNSLLILEDR
jgi:ribosomal protein S5